MAMKRCPADMHYYNPEKNPECPYCRNAQDEKIGTGVFNRMAHAGVDDKATTIPVINVPKVAAPAQDVTVPKAEVSAPKPPVPAAEEADVVTKSIFKKKAGFNPVVGWLVCIDGSEKGKDYRIRPGINEVGRDDSRDLHISIKGDDMISRRDHAEIEYDPDENSFYLLRKKNQAVKLNGEKVRQPAKLTAYDRVQFGQTTFVFLPLCAAQFNWESLDKS
ncbi:FHA domain-containing protein [Candidatus Magnetobacterium casense]|uniref:FHA domain-containing protein n=1 Tax=Candidatus Magnetobacterium casense TaxID=1455061 RepID=A0ABS6RWW4_9BACT|nr:FHA domain-containing protein [Candidatus Magnetobacterium casensis]MBV6340840.1 FHA domain-containing protein [Candidatus Magnetobacterium casensis]